MSSDIDTSTLSDEDREILAYWRKQEREQKLLAQQIKPRQSAQDPPLSFAQQRLWVVEQMTDTGSAYNLNIGLHISGPLRVDVLQQCLTEIVRRHEVLRGSVGLEQGEPVLKIHPPAPIQIELTDLGDAAAEVESAKRKFYAAAGTTVFDLERGPLVRTFLLRLSQQEHVLIICMHHMVTDAWSFNLLHKEFAALYEAYLSGKPSPLPELKIQYPDFSIWQRNWLAGDEYRRQLDYWRKQLNGFSTLELPSDRNRPLLPSFRGGVASLAIEPELKRSLTELAKREDVTLFILLLAGFALLLHRHSGQDDILLGSPAANRGRIETEELIGFFVNMLVLRSDLSGNPRFRELLRRVRDIAFEAYAHQDLPIERLVEELKIVRDTSRNPLFQVSFALQEKPRETTRQVADLTLTPASAGIPSVRFDLEMFVTESDRDLNLLAVYSADLYDADTVERMLRHYRNLLAAIAANPERRIGELEMLDAAERRQQLEAWNQTAVDYPSAQTVVDLFEARAAADSNAMAVSCEGGDLDYAQLNGDANRLAHYLLEQGVSANTPVVVLMPRCLQMIVAQLAILKAGGAYVPIDPACPPKRLAYLLSDTAAPVLLTHSGLRAKLATFGGRRLFLDSDAGTLDGFQVDNPGVQVSPDSLAYIVYTSGSTGEPKGVEVTHRGLANLVHWHCRSYRLTPADRATHLAGLGFDATVWELWPYLCAGACLHLVPDQLRLDHGALWAWLASQQITLSFMPTPMAETALQLPLPENLALRVLLTGGDRLHGGLLPANLPFRVVNHYGPSENSVVATCAEVDCADPRDPPIGFPIDNVRCFILDRYGEPVAIGVCGELYIGGTGLARGYLHQPQLTAEKFVPDPFSKRAGERLYRSGDLARYREDGCIEFAGRIDSQVQLRGFRIELGEIEAVLNREPGIRTSVVDVQHHETGGDRLVAYLVCDGEAAPADAGLRESIRDHLPEYMLPAAFVMLDELPLTVNGKVDRRALPAPQLADAEAALEHAPPRSELEQQLLQIWADVLKRERMGVHDSFFDLGGHSLMATQVVSRMREKLHVELPLSDLFAHPTIAELAQLVEALRSACESGERQRIEVVARDRLLPLSFPQQRLWYLDQLEPESLAYNIPGAIKLTGSLNIEALRDSLQQIVDRHEVLRTTFRLRDGQAVQEIEPSLRVELPLEDLGGMDEAQRDAVLRQRLNEDALQPFDLAAGPMMRSRLLRLDENRHVLVFTLHHIVTDGWSFGILFRELGALYSAFCHGRPDPLPGLRIQYADFSAWQREWLSGEVLQQQLDYWTRQLDSLSTLNLPTDRPRPAIQTFSGAHASLLLESELSARLQELNRRQSVTPFMTLLGAFAVLLGRYCHQREVVVGTPVANRNHRDIEDLIGFFVNTLVIRTEVAGEQSFIELLQRVRERSVEALQHQDLPFEALVDALQPERDRSRNPLFQVLFVVQNTPSQNLSLEGLTLESMPLDAESIRFDLELHIWTGPENLFLNVAYNTDLFDAATIERMLGHYRAILASICADPGARVRDLEMLSAAEHRQLVDDWNRTAVNFEPESPKLHELFEARVQASPGATAVEFEGEGLSYRELNQRANQLAHYLRERAVGAGSIVALCLPRGIDAVAALLAVFKAGGGYLPLDPGYPDARLGYMLEDSGARILITTTELAAKLPGAGLDVICLDADSAWRQYPEQNPACEVSPERTGYVIYTSGSTGRPKGIVMPERVLCNLLQWQLQRSAAREGSRTLQYSAFSFDVSFQEIFSTLCAGGTLVLIDEGLRRDPERLLDFIDQAAIDRLFIPFAGLNQLAEVALLTRRTPRNLREIITAGEALQVTPALEYLFERLEDCSLDNQYGPSESHVVTASRLTGRASEWPRLPGIGRPIANAKIYLLDERLCPVAVGVPGELYIGGACIADGYLGQPEMTRERFIANPFDDAPDARIYRTGDLARYRADGNIEYLGRADSQVKLRGYRIEPGEVESVILEHAGVQACAAMVREDEPGNQRLVAYVVERKNGAADQEMLREHIRGLLPDYMLPSVFVFLEQLPMTPSGKVDRKALPRPQAQQRGRTTGNLPQSEMEIILAAIWEELLEIEDIETDDMFFDLGGNSLLTIKVVERFAEQTRVRIPVASFMTQTLRQMAASAEASLEASTAEAGSEAPGALANDAPDKAAGRGFLGLFRKK